MRPILTDGEEKRWAVLVGGTEVTDYLMNFDEASMIAQDYLDDAYDDVCLYQYDTGEEVRLT